MVAAAAGGVYSSQLSVVQLTFLENLTPLALRVPEMLALQHGVAEHAAKNGPKKTKSEKIQISFNLLFLHETT